MCELSGEGERKRKRVFIEVARIRSIIKKLTSGWRHQLDITQFSK